MAFPPYVAPGQPITSAWGNDVVYSFGDVNGQIAAVNNKLSTQIHGGYTTASTDANGYVSIAYGMTFSGPPLIVASLTADTTLISPKIVTVHKASVNTTGFQVRITYVTSGTPAVNEPVEINWIAFVGYF